MADVSSSEFIKGYTKIILCAYLYKGRIFLRGDKATFKRRPWIPQDYQPPTS